MLDVGLSASLHLAQSWGIVRRTRASGRCERRVASAQQRSRREDNRERDGLAGDVICPTYDLG